MATYIDLNSDIGEGFGAYKLGDDDSMLGIVSSVNIACGFHAGDPSIMANIALKAKAGGIAIGAHPGFRDLWGFGRREIHGHSKSELQNLLIYQIGALQALAQSVGHQVTHVRTHGALANMSEANASMAKIVIEAIQKVDSRLVVMTRPDSETDSCASDLKHPVARQFFADRTYNDDGSLVSRSQNYAIISDPEIAAVRVLRMLDTQAIETISGKKIPTSIDTICVHSDTPTACRMAELIRIRLENNGVVIKPFHTLFDSTPLNNEK